MFTDSEHPLAPVQRSERPYCAVLGLILLCGGILRFYGLDIPSLWWDEMIVPLTAQFPVHYIWDWARTCEIHPPYFHYLIKLVLLSGQSDYCLRLLPALGGMASIALIYLWGKRLYSVSVGLTAAAFMAVAPLQISLSRQVRPYTIFLTLFLLSGLNLTAYLKGKRAKNLLFAALCQFGMTALHFMGLFVIIVQNIILLANTTRSREEFKRLVWFWLLSLASVLSVWPFLLHTMLDRKDMVGGTSLFNTVRDFAGDFLNINGFNNLGFNAGYFLLVLFGAFAAWRRGKNTALLLFAFLLLPMGIILGLQLGWHNPRYILYMTPALMLLAGLGLDNLPGARVKSVAVPLLICLSGTSLLLWNQAPTMYSVESFPIQGANYRELAQYLTQNMGSGDVLYTDEGLFNSARWYYARSVREDYMAGPLATSGQGNRRLLAVNGQLGEQASKNDLLMLSPLKSKSVRVGQGVVDIYDIPRRTTTVLDSLPTKKEFSGHLDEFFSQAAEWQNITPGYSKSGVHPGSVSEPGHFTWEIENKSLAKPAVFHVFVDLENHGEGNVFAITWRFDDEQPVTQVLSSMPEGRVKKDVAIPRNKDFSRLTLSFDMTCQPVTPLYPGSNLETLLFRVCRLYACEAGDDPYCQTLMAMDSLPTGLEEDQAVPQVQVQLESVEDQASGLPGWSIYKPARPGTPGVIRLNLSQPGMDGIFFHPRVEGKSSQIEVYSGGEEERNFVSMVRGIDRQWTPIGLHYPIQIPHGAKTVKIVLKGPQAQVWHKDEQVLQHYQPEQ